MCGIFGLISENAINKAKVEILAKHSEQRGKDSSGLFFVDDDTYKICRADFDIEKLLKKVRPFRSPLVLGHSRLITNGLGDNQPVVRNKSCVLHNGIIVNENEVWNKINSKRLLEIDSEIILAIADEHLSSGEKLEDLPERILKLCKGVIACAIVFTNLGKLMLFSNNGSLYFGKDEKGIAFASESYALSQNG